MRKRMVNYGLIVLLIVGIIVLVNADHITQTISIVRGNLFPESISQENIFPEKLSSETAVSGMSTEQNQKEEICFGMDVPIKYEENIDERNRINAVISIPDCIREKGFLKATAKEKEISQDKVKKMLEQYYRCTYDLEDEYSMMYRGKDDSLLSFEKNTGGVYFMTDTYSLLRTAYNDQPRVEEYNRDLYAVNKDLENFTLDECDEKLYEMFAQFNMEGDFFINHRAMEYQIMKEEAVVLHEDGSLTKPEHDWSDADNSYYCTVSQLCNGIPILPVDYFCYYEDILNRGAHTFVLNKERTVGFDVSRIYDIAYHNEYVQLLEFEEVLAEYRNSPKLMGDGYYTEITDISLRIMATAGNGQEYSMIPVWIFYGYWTDTEKAFKAPFAILINGITGDEL